MVIQGQREAGRGGLRVPLEVMPGMDAWPPALRRAALVATARGVELSYRERGGAGACFVLQAESGGRRPALRLAVVSNEFEAERGRRLEAALQRAVQRVSPRTVQFVADAAALVSRIGAKLEPAHRRQADADTTDAGPALPPEVQPILGWVEHLERDAASLSVEALASIDDAGLRLGLALAHGNDEQSLFSADAVIDDAGAGAVARALALTLVGRESEVEWERFDPDARYQFAVYRQDWATALFMRRDRINPSRRAAELIAIGDHALQAGEPEWAGRAALAVLEQRDASEDEWVEAGAQGVRAGVIDAVLERFEARFADQPSRPLAVAAAQWNLWRDHVDAAEAWLARCPFDATDVDSLCTRGGIAIRRGQYEQARPDLEAALELDPRHRESTVWLGESYLREDRDEEGIAVLDRFDKKVTGEHAVGKALQSLGNDTTYTVRPGDHDCTAYIYRFIGERTLGRRITDFSREPIRQYIWETIEAYGGNRSSTPTLCRDGVLSDAAHIAPPRVPIVHMQHSLRYTPLEEVLAGLDELRERYPYVPFGQTYAAELHLWAGNYDVAEREFRSSWDLTRQRWGYVGLGAALLMLGRHEEAIELLRYGPKSKYGEIPGEATPVYIGEAMMAVGRRDEGRAEIERATELRPNRLGAWGALALAHAAHGDDQKARAAARRYLEAAPLLSWEAQRKLGRSPSLELADEDLVELARTALAMQRGNRSSYMLTFFDAAGRLRVIETVSREQRLRRLARHCLPALVRELLASVLRRAAAS